MGGKMSPQYHAEYFQRNKEKLSAVNKAYYEANKEHIQKQTRERTLRNYEKVCLRKIKQNASTAGIPFDLEESDLVIPAICPYLKVPITKILGEGRVPTNPSADRIIPELGYIKGNVQIISEMANRMKQNASIEQLLTFSRSVLERHGP